MGLMCQQEGTVGFTVFILMEGRYLLERGVRKTKRKYFAATTEINHSSANVDPKNKKSSG